MEKGECIMFYLEDEENLFLQEYDIKNYHRHETPHKDSDIVDYLPTDLVSENQTKERVFRVRRCLCEREKMRFLLS